MNKIVICLRGKGSIGKSRTIKMVYDLLKTCYPNSPERYRSMGRVDIRVILTLNEVDIGIESRGDPSDYRLKESLKYFVDEGCKIILCASRTTGQTVMLIDDLSPYYSLNIINQSIQLNADKQQDNNEEMAKIIYNLIIEAIFNQQP
jgi:hypothetical protein